MTKEQVKWEEFRNLFKTKEGRFDLAEYPNILEQMKSIDKKLNEDYTFESAAMVADTIIRTIDQMSPQIYEYYRELVELFKKNVKRAMKELEDNGAAADSESLALFRSAVETACSQHILLAEKYLMD